MEKINSNFLNELFKLMFTDLSVVRICSQHLSYSLIPKELGGLKAILKEVIDQFKETNKLPSIGVVAQKYNSNLLVQDCIKDIKAAQLADKELIIDQLELYVKEVEFQILNKKVYDLYNDGKVEQSIKLNSEESQRILSISLRNSGQKFTRVFRDVKQTLSRNKEESEKTVKGRKIPFGIDKLDELCYGGASPEDTALWIMRSGVGKALSLDSDIITPKGIVKLKDVKVGMEILGMSGKSQLIVGVYPQGTINCYKVTFSDGTSVKCNDQHIWTVADKRAPNKWNNYTLQEILDKGLFAIQFPRGLHCEFELELRWAIPNQGVVNFQKQPIPKNPYTFGVLLKDKVEATQDNTSTKDIHIPQEYLFNEKDIRVKLLQGFLGLKVEMSFGEKRVLIVPKSCEKLAQDLAFLARGLGHFCTVKSIETVQGQAYEILIEFWHSERDNLKRFITSIELIGKQEMQCIEVSNEDGLFMTNDFVVTHNSTALRHHGMSAALQGYKVLHIQLEGGKNSVVDKYTQMWVNQTYQQIKKGELSELEWRKIQKTVSEMESFQRDIDVYSFDKFEEATVHDIRNLIIEYYKIYGYYPELVILDSLDLLMTGNSKIDLDPRLTKFRLQTNAQKIKNMAVEFSNVWITATQTGDVPKEIWDAEDRVIDRSYTEGDRTLVKPFSFVFSNNVTTSEKKRNLCRIYVDKLRDYKSEGEVIKICTNYDKGRFYDRAKSMLLEDEMPVLEGKKKRGKKDVGADQLSKL